MVGLIRRALVVLAAAAALIAGAAQAQTTGGSVRVTPLSIVPTQFSSAGEIMATATYEGRFAAATTGAAPMAQSLFYQRELTVSKATLGALARKRIAQIPAAAVTFAVWTAAIAGVGWFIDEITREVRVSTPGYVALTDQMTGYYNVNGWGPYASISAATKGLAASVCSVYSATWKWNASAGQNQWFVNYLGIWAYNGTCVIEGTTWIVPRMKPGFPYPTGVNEPNAVPPNPAWPEPAGVTDAQLADVVKATPTLWPEPFKWPDGSPKIVTPMPAQMAQIAAQYRTDTGIPIGTAAADPVYAAEEALDSTAAASEKTGTATNPQTATGTSSAASAEKLLDGSGSLKLPGFCSWAATVCDAIVWFKSEPGTEADLPVPEKPITAATWASGLGDGSCPAPIDVVLSHGSARASYQPLCDLATGIKPFLLIAAAVVSAFILAG